MDTFDAIAREVIANVLTVSPCVVLQCIEQLEKNQPFLFLLPVVLLTTAMLTCLREKLGLWAVLQAPGLSASLDIGHSPNLWWCMLLLWKIGESLHRLRV